MSKALKILIRADASPDIGGGHVMRCLALANRLADEGARIVFAVRRGSVETVPLLSQSGYETHNLEANEQGEVKEIASHLGTFDWLIIDHYRRGKDFEIEARSFAKKVMVIDDLANRPHDCDLLLDQTYGRDPEDYAPLVLSRARILTGSDYALLRTEFADLRPKALERRTKSGPVRRILVSLGACDPGGGTIKALQAIAAGEMDVSVDVVTGTIDTAAWGLEEFAQAMPQQVAFHGFDADVAKLMLEADLAIGAGGSSTWERCCLGLPTLMVVTADNQEKIAQELEKVGAVINLGNLDGLQAPEIGEQILRLVKDFERCHDMSKCAFELCDGLGANRCALEIEPECSKDGKPVRLRKTVAEDCRWLFDLQNYPETRCYSNTPEPPEWQDHQGWFSEKLHDPSTLLYIIEYDGSDVGMLRLDERDMEKGAGYIISIAIAPHYKQLGIASAVLRIARQIAGNADLYAEIDSRNKSSLGLFRGSGYKQISERWFVHENQV